MHLKLFLSNLENYFVSYSYLMKYLVSKLYFLVYCHEACLWGRNQEEK